MGTTMNIINLDAYREQKAQKRPSLLSGAGAMFRFAGWPPLEAAVTKPAFMMCWVMFVPTMPMMLPAASRAVAFGA